MSRSILPENRLLPVMVCASTFLIGFQLGGLQLVLRSVTTEFGIRIAGIGFLASAETAGAVIAPFLLGSLSDRIGKRRVMLTATLLFLSGCLLCALSRGAALFAAGAFCVGAGYSGTEVAGTAMLADRFPDTSYRAISLSQCLLCVGAVAAPPVAEAGITAGLWDWRFVFFFCAGALGLLAAGYAALPSDALSAPGLHPHGSKSVSPTGPDRAARQRYPAVFVLLLISVVLYSGLENGLNFVESLFASEFGAASLGAAAVSCYWIGMALSRLVLTGFSLRPVRALCFSYAAAAALMLILSLSRTQAVSLAVLAMLGAVNGPIWTLHADLAAKLRPGQSGRALGAVSSCGGAGGTVFSALLGLTAEKAGLRTPFALLAAVAAVSFCIWFSIAAHDRKAAP